MNQCLREHDASFLKRQSYFNLLELNRDEERFDTNMHVRQQTNFHRRSEDLVSLKKRHDRLNSFAQNSLFTRA
jgi:hypothetical protein